MIKEAMEVEPGEHVQPATGSPIKVLCSNPLASSAADVWHIEGYAEGEATSRILCSPAFQVEVLA